MLSLPSLGATLSASGPTGAPVGAGIRSDPQTSPKITQEAAPNESQSAPKLIATSDDLLFVAVRL
jgi:hypothetical protein